MTIKGEQLYELGWLPIMDLSSLQPSFNKLPEDKYAEKRLRSRRYSCYRHLSYYIFPIFNMVAPWYIDPISYLCF